jgi:SpoVK/Ycf46/Vps4 family AAA+-type ATPase
MVVSKYIGETEKNLELLFARAENKKWILFFDEADALFGKRTNVRDAHDKYANQEVSYLLQRIEDYDGLVILATNMKNNIDEAFVRRFNSILKFSIPDTEERKKIWQKTFPPEVEFREKDIIEVVKKYELSGGNIVNVVHYAGIKAAKRQQTPEEPLIIYLPDVVDGIRHELTKSGVPFNFKN